MTSVRNAQRQLAEAQQALRSIEERAKLDETVTAIDLVVARAGVDLASLRLTGASEAEVLSQTAAAERLQDASEARRRRRHEAHLQEVRAGQQRAIEDGSAEELYSGLGSADARRKLSQIRAWKASGDPTWPGYDHAPTEEEVAAR